MKHGEGLPPGIRVFEEHWDRYDSWYDEHRLLAESEARVVEASLRNTPRPLVEIGVGTGFFAHRLKADLGIDPAYSMLRVARRRGLQVVQGVGEHPPLRQASMGTVLIVVTICFAADPLGLLKGAVETLSRGGRLVSCIIPRDSPWGQLYVEQSRQGNVFYAAARFYTVGEVMEMYREVGVELLECWSTITYPPYEEPRLEEPRKGCRGSFVCIGGRKHP